MIKTIEDVALAAARIPIDVAYPLEAPMNTAFNSVCPFSIKRKACRSVGCSLRVAKRKSKERERGEERKADSMKLPMLPLLYLPYRPHTFPGAYTSNT